MTINPARSPVLMRRAALLAGCALIVGCAGGEPVDDPTDPQTASGAIDGGVDAAPTPDPPGPVNPPQGAEDPPDDPQEPPPQDPPPQDPPPQDPPDEPCEPFTRLGVCSICGPDGAPQAPETDAQCPPVECGEELAYAQVSEDGDIVCYETRRDPGDAGGCLDVGVCATADDLCGETVRVEVARITDGPCAEMVGCAGLAPPEVIERIGQPCHTHGVCNIDGVCSAPPECEDFDPQVARRYCSGGYEGAAPWCEFFVDPPGDASCTAVCAAQGMICAAAWDENDNSCQRNDARGCDAAANDFVCRCRAP